MGNDQQGFGTRAIHAGQTPDSATNSRAVPLYQTSAYVFDSSEHAANLFALKESGNIYTRIMNPTTDVLEQRLASLEGGVGALAVSSGQAAITLAVLNITRAGQNIVASSYLYGGTYTLFHYTLARLGIEARFVNTGDPAAVAAAIDANTRLVYTESVGNPKNNVDDFAALAKVAHDAGIPLIVDNTVPSPALFRPIEAGADVVIHSLTKYICGHGTSIGGAVVDSGTFDWTNGRFPELVEPDPSYHGISYTGAVGPLAYIVRMRVALLRDMGPCISPFNSWLMLQGLETLHVRMERHAANALAVARFLEQHPAVGWVNYPGLPSHPNHANAQRYMPGGACAIVGFGIKGGREAGRKLIDSVQLASHLANIGDAKTLIIHPASTTHQQLTPEQQVSSGVTDDFVRLCVGIEDVADIIADLDQALAASQA